MTDAFELLDVQAAQDFLRRFPIAGRRQGEALFQAGQVLDLVPEEPGLSYFSTVGDGEDHEVTLFYDPPEGWAGTCSCGGHPGCGHVFAAMSALLAEHRMAAVRGLSAGSAGTLARLAAGRAKSESRSSELAGLLLTAVGRNLANEEKQFLRNLHQIYERCRQSRQINHWDFQQMGLPLNDAAWGPLSIWPSFPETEQEFWLYVANALQERGLGIPGFMQPISDLGPIQERLARWRRALEIDKWKQALGNLAGTSRPPAPQDLLPIDLRLALDEVEVVLEWRRPDHGDFEPIKPTPLRRLAMDYENDQVQFTQEGELLWQLFSQAHEYGIRPRLDYSEPPALRILSRCLRLRLLESRIVTLEGQPLPRPTEPLRWELSPASDEKGDYRLRLVQSDGSPAPPILAALPGSPTLYLTRRALFIGPAPPPTVVDPSHENRIPAPALERASGVAFLQALGLELPPRLKDRVRVLPFQTAITCELRPIYPGSDTEECVVKVLAETADGRQQFWSGMNWIDMTPRGARKREPREAGIVVHDSTALARIPRLLEPLSLKPGRLGGLAFRVTKKFPETFAAWLKSLPADLTVHLQGELASLTAAEVAGRVKLEVTEAEIDWFDLRVVVDVADTTLTPEEIKLLLNAKGGYVRLKGKGWRRLRYDLGEEDHDRLARLGLSTRELSAEPQRLHTLQLADEAARKFLPEQQVEQLHRRAAELKARVAPELPSGVTANLRPYQLEGYHFLAYLATNRFGGILADDMGLGKTVQTLAWLLWLRNQAAGITASPVSGNGSNPPEAGAPSEATPILTEKENAASVAPSLVVCPKSVMDNWHAEAARFTPGLRVRSWAAAELGEFSAALSTADLHVLNYSQLRSLGATLAPVRWQAVILDEGQYIKNPNSQTAQVARSLRSAHRLILSGTPIENRLLDLWSLMSFAMPGALSNRAQFTRLYDVKGDPFARRRLAARVRPFVLRRTKTQVAKDLPDRIEEDLFCEIEGEQKTLYRAELKRAQHLLLGIQTQQELARQQFNFLTSLLRLRQICCHPRLLNPESAATSAKTEALLEQLEPLMDEGQKVLVFSQFVGMLDLLRPALLERNWPVFYLAGHTENRGELVRQFQSAEGPAVFLISLKAGGFGLNLTAASYVVLFDPWWNPAVESQAIDRTHRIGQTNKVIAYRLLIKDSIEEKIRALQRLKKALADDVLGEEKFAQSLTLDDLRFLFAD